MEKIEELKVELEKAKFFINAEYNKARIEADYYGCIVGEVRLRTIDNMLVKIDELVNSA